MKYITKSFLKVINCEKSKRLIEEAAIKNPERLIEHVVNYIKKKEEINETEVGKYFTKKRNFLLVIDNAE